MERPLVNEIVQREKTHQGPQGQDMCKQPLAVVHRTAWALRPLNRTLILRGFPGHDAALWCDGRQEPGPPATTLSVVVKA